MATITKHIPIATDVDSAWAALRDVGNPHHVFAPVLTDARLEGDSRVVTFANGMVVRERIVTLDDDARRLAYTVEDGPFTHHHASFTVAEGPGGTCTVTWVSDLLPDDVAPMVEGLMAEGAAALAVTLGC
ncbi:MAG: SRPBCC family protein [Acidimicrobiales bacterium]